MKRLNLSVIVGSNRKESINRKLASALATLGEHTFELTLSGSTISRPTMKI